ncbi:DUF4279 domain-containing protein [Deinococcus aluminii]|uniref:DUF4279 domain-containing protein n=1 Tax=Deinococcus aluminii TaxID=1656885 RepID=UPI0031F13415
MIDDEIELLRLSFTLLGTFDPDFITNHFKITPTRTAVRQEGGQGKPKVAKDIWELSKVYSNYFDTDKYIESFLNKIMDISEKLRILQNTTELEGVLSCVIWLDQESSSPNIYLSELAISHLNDLGISFNVSLYFL